MRRLALLDRLERGEALAQRVELARGDDGQDAADVALVGGQPQRLDDERVLALALEVHPLARGGRRSACIPGGTRRLKAIGRSRTIRLPSAVALAA